MADQSTRIECPSHSELFQQNGPPSALFVLQSGRVKLHRQSGDKRQILGLPAPGDCLGAESVPTGAPSPFSATTLTSVAAISIPPDAVRALLDAHPDFQEAFLRLISERLKQFVTLVHDLAFRDVTSRLATVLLARAETEGQFHDDGVMIDRLLSQNEYAELVGTAREVVSRTFRRLEDDQLIVVSPRTILIRDLAMLRTVAAQESR